ncbi:MAG TPA: hypothetical protein VG841_09225 [Caulobacterales bacterium]|nr:hypothetical protein [Caulobacterales bacterium]
MFRKLVAAVLVAGLAAFAPVAAVAQSSTAGVTATEADRAFGAWMERYSAILAHASRASDALSRFVSVAPGASREDILAVFAQIRVASAQGRDVLREARAEAAALPAFQAPDGSTTYDEAARGLRRDLTAYIDNIDRVLDIMIQVADAFANNDTATARRLAPQLQSSAILLVDGQIITLRARQQMAPPNSTTYHGLGAMIELYRGMRALAVDAPEGRANALLTAADAMAATTRAHRAALTLERADLVSRSAEERAFGERFLAVEDRFMALNDRVEAALRLAAEDADPATVRARYMPMLIQSETEYQSLTQEQLTMFNEAVGERR